MKNRIIANQKMTCEKARDVSIFDLLIAMGFEAKKNTEKEAWFLSPFREESDASFKVSKDLNRWYDHGAGLGGNTLDFVIGHNKCNVKEALQFLGGNSNSFSFQKHSSQNSVAESLDHKILIEKVGELKNTALVSYVEQRNIDIKTARLFCKEVHYQFNGKTYFSIGLKNISGGWELRNKYFKNSSSPKDYTYFKNGKQTLKVVEGMFDFLSLITIFPESLKNSDFVILNSIAFKNNVVMLFPDYTSIELYLDSGNSGREATDFLMAESSNCIDRSDFYKTYEDLNEWHQNN
jgi:hypothetical protein